MSVSDRWARTWPALLAVAVVAMVGAPAAVASYRHAKDVVISTGDLVMAPWLPLSVDGMLLAALVVIWVRRHRGEDSGKGPWAAFGFGMVVTVAANLEAVNLQPTPLGPATGTDYVVALFPPLCLAIALELVALVAYRTRPLATQASTGDQASTDIPELPEIPEAPESPERQPAGDAGGDLVAKARQLVAAGAGRPKLVKELAVTDHQARQLLAQVRAAGAA